MLQRISGSRSKYGPDTPAVPPPRLADAERMERFCDDLRHEREQRHVSLHDISAQTKVSTRYLQALEDGRFGELPGGVFRKGILRGYLGVLELDPAPWVERLDALLLEGMGGGAMPQTAISEFAENVRRGRPEPAGGGHKCRWLGVLFMIFGLAALCSCVWIFALRGHLAL